MVICNNCRSSQLDGTVFCLECGASLMYAGAADSTRELLEKTEEHGGSGLHVGHAAAPSSGITLVVLRTRRRISCEPGLEMLIGRQDTARGIEPDIDLGGDGGHDAGVSRRHAMLSWRDGVCYIEDLSSANGTYLNGKRLAPQVPTPLADGDELACGTLRMRVEIG
ncbi:MAG: FHA domain-containing protein [Chloroflexota bacterium]|nr:MAG: FHA domain-containing protein [Chloroflexota bacterium]